jgi:hypothetical protein
VKLKATIIVAALLATTAAHADTIYLKCWAQGLTGDQRPNLSHGRLSMAQEAKLLARGTGIVQSVGNLP